ncbi:hypothetical protein HMPREF0591_5242, partial [Mycobacterium parascrofulaceum ATCC BAA-614]
LEVEPRHLCTIQRGITLPKGFGWRNGLCSTHANIRGRGSGCTCWTSSTRSASTSAMCECVGAAAAWDRSPLTDRWEVAA